jgi:hypothetical protein
LPSTGQEVADHEDKREAIYELDDRFGLPIEIVIIDDKMLTSVEECEELLWFLVGDGDSEESDS